MYISAKTSKQFLKKSLNHKILPTLAIARQSTHLQSGFVALQHMNMFTLNKQNQQYNQFLREQTRSFASQDLPNHIKLEMPNLSPTMEKGNIAKWMKKEGDQIKPGDILATIETDKATVDFEMQEDGYIAKLLYPEGAKDVKLGQVVAIIVENKDDVSKFSSYSGEAKPAPSQPKVEAPSATQEDKRACPVTRERPSSEPDQALSGASRVKASPIAQNLASQTGVNIKDIKGTGPNDRVIKADVIDAKKQTQKQVVSNEYIDNANNEERRQILSYSKQNIPHYYVTIQVQLDNLMKLRTQLNKFAKNKLTLSHLLYKASALAALKVPATNSQWQGDFIRYYKNVNLGVAVQTDEGYQIPVVRDANKKGLDQIAAELVDLTKRAKEGKLTQEDVQGATFTVSNLGMFGVENFQTIVLPPQACILAVGAAQKKVLVSENKDIKYEVGHVLNVTLSSDHRVVDGALAAQFGQEFKKYIENPETLLL